MLSGETVTTPRPRPPAQTKRSTPRSLLSQASPPPPYASSFSFPDRKEILGSPLPATLQEVEENPDSSWLSEKSREELAELLLKADDLIKNRETELGVTSAVCKSLYESNVTLKNKHDALVARIPATPTPRHSPPLFTANFSVPFPGGMHSKDPSFDASPVYPKRLRRISVSPKDISLLSDQNAELLQKLETLESEALSADRTGRRALKQLEREIQLLRDELEKTQERSEQLEKNAQAGTEKIVEEMWRKKKQREAKFRAMRKNNGASGQGYGLAEVRDFAPPGPFTKASLSPSNSAEFPSSDDDDPEPSFDGDQQSLVSQLLSKIQELEETNTRIIQQQSETTDKLHAVQRETESISKVYEYFSAQDGVEWEVVDEEGRKSPIDGTVRFRSFRRTLEAAQAAQAAQQDDGFQGLLTLPRKSRGSVIDLFGAANEAGPSKLAFPYSHRSDSLSSSTSELSPLRYEFSQSQTPYNMSPAMGATLQSELGSEFGDDADPFARSSRHGSIYDLSFSLSPSPSINNLSLRSRVSDARTSRNQPPATSTPLTNALQLNVEPPTPSAHPDERGSMRGKTKDRQARMSQTLLRRTSRWVDGRFSTGSSGSANGEATPRPTLPQRLSTALELVMENFGAGGTVRTEDKSVAATRSASPYASVSGVSEEGEDSTVTVMLDGGAAGRNSRAIVRFVLEVWLWLQFGIIILVFLWAMARRGPKAVLGEVDKKAVVRRR
ncbi:hypothetical protein C8R47DRAFT_1025115 [Mycena vitilis]|nr:hypothetical protein C8R47DRAFT_1025115 [Mycena vitilis]